MLVTASVQFAECGSAAFDFWVLFVGYSMFLECVYSHGYRGKLASSCKL